MKTLEKLRSAYPDFHFSVCTVPAPEWSGWRYSLTVSNNDGTARGSSDVILSDGDDASAIFKKVADDIVRAIT